MAKGTPPQVTDESKRTKVFDYEIPLRIDGRQSAIEGTLFWVGPTDTSKAPFLIAGAAIVLLGGRRWRSPGAAVETVTARTVRQRKPGSAAKRLQAPPPPSR
jgi:hypothetical protein